MNLGEGVKGTIGIIGPKRMDYENVMDNLKNLKVQLDNILKGNDIGRRCKSGRGKEAGRWEEVKVDETVETETAEEEDTESDRGRRSR